MKPKPTTIVSLARRRARARRRSAGAVIFIVATTLGVLAVMGAYALAATTQDLRAAGNMQAGAQATAVAYYGGVATSEYINYNNVDSIINNRMKNPSANLASSDRNCRSTQRNDPTLFGDTSTKACVRLTAKELQIAWCGGVTCPSGVNGDREPFTAQSMTHTSTVTTGIDGDVDTEITNPAPAGPRAGFAVVGTPGSPPATFAMLTMHTYASTNPRGTTNIETLRSGRGRIIVGPLFNQH